MGECVSVYLESVNITFGFFKIFHFSLCLYSMVFTWSFPFYFPGDLRKRLGKFVTLHSSNSSIACFHVVLNISWPFIWLTFHLAVHSPGNFRIWASFLFHSFHCCFPMFHHCSLYFFHFHPITLPLSVCPRLVKLVLIFWDKVIGLPSTWFTILCFLKNVS